MKDHDALPANVASVVGGENHPGTTSRFSAGGVSGTPPYVSDVSIPVRIDSTDASAISCIIASHEGGTLVVIPTISDPSTHTGTQRESRGEIRYAFECG
jgi:hypothetical protein